MAKLTREQLEQSHKSRNLLEEVVSMTNDGATVKKVEVQLPYAKGIFDKAKRIARDGYMIDRGAKLNRYLLASGTNANYAQATGLIDVQTYSGNKYYGRASMKVPQGLFERNRDEMTEAFEIMEQEERGIIALNMEEIMKYNERRYSKIDSDSFGLSFLRRGKGELMAPQFTFFGTSFMAFSAADFRSRQGAKHLLEIAMRDKQYCERLKEVTAPFMQPRDFHFELSLKD